MFIEKNLIISSVKVVSVLFLFTMLYNGVVHLKNDFSEEIDVDGSLSGQAPVDLINEDLLCINTGFIMMFYFALGAFWSHGAFTKFGLI